MTSNTCFHRITILSKVFHSRYNGLMITKKRPRERPFFVHDPKQANCFACVREANGGM